MTQRPSTTPKNLRTTVINAGEAARASIARAIVTGVAKVVGALVGLGFAALGFLLVWSELKSPPLHSTHIYIAVALVLFGGLCIAPSIVGASLKFVVVTVGPYVPVIGGRRAGDPPAAPAPAETGEIVAGQTLIRRPIGPPNQTIREGEQPRRKPEGG